MWACVGGWGRGQVGCSLWEWGRERTGVAGEHGRRLGKAEYWEKVVDRVCFWKLTPFKGMHHGQSLLLETDPIQGNAPCR